MPDRPDPRLRVIDVRPTIARGEHPVDEVLAAADALAPQGVLELVAPFEPRPLMKRLGERGCVVESALVDGLWFVRAGKGALPALEDVSALEAPEPMERVLATAAALAPGGVCLARLPRYPLPLVAQLEARALEHAVALRPDGTALVWIRRPQ